MIITPNGFLQQHILLLTKCQKYIQQVVWAKLVIPLLIQKTMCLLDFENVQICLQTNELLPGKWPICEACNKLEAFERVSPSN